jgi:hypothetical protein
MISVAVINRPDALQQTALSLGLLSDAGDTPALNRILIAQSLRRTVYIAAPCDAQTTRSLVEAALVPLSGNPDALNEQIDDALQDIIAMGDVLEMRSDSGARSDTVLRPAPPAFVARPDGLFLILGISGDDLTPALGIPVLHHASGLRSARPTNAEQCRSALLDLGLTELSERVWLHAPATASAAEHAAQCKARLPAELRPEKIENFEVLDGALPTSFYKRRWSLLHTRHTGMFVARRPQRYGAKLWCLADVKDGVVQRFVDIHAVDSRARDCDEAWRLQAAMDAEAGTPQQVEIAVSGTNATLSFSAPLPTWAARRLHFIGEQVSAPRALIAFEMPAASVDHEANWLKEKLWLARKDEGGVA